MAWIDKYGDRNNDGFQEYRTRSSHGHYNQGWKDAGDAIVEADGTLSPLPIATCELQGYVYDAKIRMAEIYDVLERPEDAKRLRREAKRLYDRFNDRFWWEEEGTYYLGLNGRREPIRSVASNAGHLLQSGIVPPERAERVVRRLMAPDMWSGWGIRTLSSDHPYYNPFSYQTGSVWPHDNATIAGGFRRYGFNAEAAEVAKGIFDAAERLVGQRLPELFSGLPRVPASFPVPYLGANVPQAWAAGSVFRFVAILCGLHATTDADGSAAVRQSRAARLDAGDQDPEPAGRRRVAGRPPRGRGRRGALERPRATRWSTPRRRVRWAHEPRRRRSPDFVAE